MTDNNGKATLYAKMAKIMGEINRLPKDSETKSGPKYRFTSDSAVADLVRQKLAENNIAFFAEMYDVTQTPVQSARGADGNHTIAHMRFTFACGDTGESETREWRGECLDYGDKGINKASTGGEKFFLLKTFVMSTGESADDPDTHSEPMTRQPQQRRAQPARNQAQPPSKASADAAPPDAGDQGNGTLFTGAMMLAYKRELDDAGIADHVEHAQNIIFEAMREAHKITEFTDIFKHTDAEVRAAVEANRANQPDADGGGGDDGR